MSLFATGKTNDLGLRRPLIVPVLIVGVLSVSIILRESKVVSGETGATSTSSGDLF